MFKKLALVAAGALVVATPAFAQSTNSTAVPANAHAKAKLWSPITFVVDGTNDTLYFGAIARQSSYDGSGTVSLAADGTLTCTATGLTCSDTPTLAKFLLTASNNSDVKITLGGAPAVYDPTSSVVTMTGAVYGDTIEAHLEVDGASADATTTDQDDYKTLGTDNADPINVFGQLAVPTTTAARNDIYSADFTITAEYI